MNCRLIPVIFSLFVAPMVHAQTTAGRLVGAITDQSGAVTPGVKVVATNIETGKEMNALSNGQGQYMLYPLPPGVYQVVAQKEGFQTVRFESIRIDVADTVVRNITLEVGRLEQQVTVAADAAPLLTETPSVQSTITREQIDTLPLNGRDYNQLVLLAAGAVDNSVGGNTDFGAYALNGNRAFSNEYLLDGTPNNNVFQGRSAVPLSIDVIGEFKVTSGVAPAEYGQAGTQINVASRGGTNRFHGNLFEYHRGNTWEARDPFNTLGEQPFRRNQFGGSLGGPVLLPGYNGRNRTFFFFNYEGNLQEENVTRVSTVPLETFWRGDFSSLLARNIQLGDPLLANRPVIPNNRLDLYLGGALISKAASQLRPFLPNPNLLGDRNNLRLFPEQITKSDQFTLRGDQTLPHHQSLSARFTYSNTGGFTPNLIGVPGVGRTEPLDSRQGSITWSAPFGSHTVNELRIGALNFSDIVNYLDGGLPTTELLGLKGFDPGNSGIPPLPRIQFSGIDAFSELKYGSTPSFGEAALSMIGNTFTLSETLSHSRGKHNFKAGFEARRTYLNVLQQTNARGQITFRGANTATSTGYSFADFLMGLPGSTSQVPIKSKILLTRMEYASFIQDDWRITPRLNLSLGLRHELFLNPYEERNRLAMFDIATGAIVVASDQGRLPTNEFLPSVVARLTDANGIWRFPLLSDQDAGFTPQRLLETRLNNWGPRVGFSYRLDSQGRSVIRSGYGIFYTRFPVQYLLQTVAVNPPFAGLFSYSQAIRNGQPALTVDSPYAATGAGVSVSPLGIQRDWALPDNQQWNLSVEREIGWNTVVNLGYVGNKGTHLFRSMNANGPYLDPANGKILRRYSSTYGTSSILFRQTDGNSIYHAMQLEARRRMSKGLAFQSNWTWAKGIDDVGLNVQTAVLDIENLGRDRANSDYVRRHTISINATYDLPFGRGKAFLPNQPAWLETAVGGWRLSGIWHYSTGRYLTPSFSSTSGLSNNRPDIVLGADANLPRSQRSPDHWFNPAAFTEVPAVDPITGLPRFGTAGRNIIVGPGLNVIDASLAKSIQLFGEGRRLTFRLEAFNLLNHPNYGNPDTNMSNVNTVAAINGIIRPMRQVQFALRFDF